jgi:hypothetical protein
MVPIEKHFSAYHHPISVSPIIEHSRAVLANRLIFIKLDFTAARTRPASIEPPNGISQEHIKSGRRSKPLLNR